MKRIKIISLFCILVLSVNIVMAFSSEYLKDNTLRILKGHDEDFRILLQNPDDYEKTFKIEVGSNITTIKGDQNTFLLLPYSNKEVFLIISPPTTSKLGDTFGIGYKVGEATVKKDKEKTMITIGSAISKSFIALIVSQNRPKFDENITKQTAYVGKWFDYNVNCTDEDGDQLYYSLDNDKLSIDDDGTISFKPKWRGKIKTQVTCTDNVETAKKDLIIRIKDKRFFMRWWFQIPILMLIIAVIVIKLKKKKHGEETPIQSQ